MHGSAGAGRLGNAVLVEVQHGDAVPIEPEPGLHCMGGQGGGGHKGKYNKCGGIR